MLKPLQTFLLNITTQSKVRKALANIPHVLVYLACTSRNLQHHVKMLFHLFHSLFHEPLNVLKALRINRILL